MNHGAIIRGMSTAEGAHPRAKYNMHTGYREGQGGLRLSVDRLDRLARNSAAADFPLPNFVSIGNRSYGAGFLGPSISRSSSTTRPAASRTWPRPSPASSSTTASALLEELEAAFYRDYQADSINDHKTTYERAVS